MLMFFLNPQAAVQNLVGKVEVVVENLILAQSGLNIVSKINVIITQLFDSLKYM